MTALAIYAKTGRMGDGPFSSAWFNQQFAAKGGKHVDLAEFAKSRNVDLGADKISKVATGKRAIQRKELAIVWDFFGLDRALFGEAVRAFTGDVELDVAAAFTSPAERRPESNAQLDADRPPIDSAVFKGPRNVPVYGAAVGGAGGDFRLNGRIIDHAPRPPGIAHRRDVFVVYVVGDSVSPKYEDGDPLYVDPHRRPAPRDYVFVELWGASEDEPGDALIKRLIGRRGGNLLLEQHNPEGPLDPIPEETVKRVHRVIPWPELLGI